MRSRSDVHPILGRCATVSDRDTCRMRYSLRSLRSAFMLMVVDDVPDPSLCLFCFVFFQHLQSMPTANAENRVSIQSA